MGIVYKAQDTKLDRLVALKFLPHHLTLQTEGGQAANEAERSRFLQEAKAAAALNHPNICMIYGIEEYGDEQFIIMEFVDGKTLRSQITNVQSQIPLDQIVDWGLQIGGALAAAHEKEITHRDIKPDNIMVNAKNQIKVMDFGLAKLKGSLGVTRTGATVGTIVYMSPEQIRGLEVDQRTDLWAFGVVLYEMLTGGLPFRGQYEPAIMYEILNVHPRAIQTVRFDVPDHLQVLVSRLLQKDPTKRISSAAEIIQLMKKPPVTAPSTLSEKSIAVLYFENMSSEKESEYFCAGMTEDIITDLSKIKELKVVSRTDVLPLRNNEAAIQMFENASSLDPNFAAAYAALAEAYSYMYSWYDGDQKWLGKTIEVSQKALNLDPNSIEAQFGTGTVYFHQKQLNEAKRTWEKVIQQNPDFYDAYRWLGISSDMTGDYDAALRYYEQCARLKPFSEEPWMHVDMTLRRKGDNHASDQAQRKLLEVGARKLEVNPNDAITLSRMAGPFAHFGEIEKSYAALKRVLEIDPTDGLAQYNCACTYAVLGNKKEALACLKNAFQSGYKNVNEWVKSDPDLVSLHKDPEFEALLAEIG